MTSRIQQVLLTEILQQWLSLAERSRPWGMWIRQYPPLQPQDHDIPKDAWPEQVWFVDEHGLRPQSIWAWRRFVAVHSEQPWCTRAWKEPAIGVLGNPHRIGLAGFAPYAESADLYLETIWGGTFGQGLRVNLAEEGQVRIQSVLWLS